MKIEIPLNDWVVGRKKYNLSLNTYRNNHHQINNKIKHLVSDYLLQYKFKKYNRINISYEVYFRDNRSRDIMNFVSVVDKYLLDHIVNIGSLKDDNYNFYSGGSFKFMGKSNINKIVADIKEIK